MTIQEIRDNISSTDKNIAADRFNCSVRYVEMVLAGDRKEFTERAQMILSELEFLANLNIIINNTKYRKACEVGAVIFARPFESQYRPEVARTKKIELALAKKQAKLSNQNQAA